MVYYIISVKLVSNLCRYCMQVLAYPGLNKVIQSIGKTLAKRVVGPTIQLLLAGLR